MSEMSALPRYRVPEKQFLELLAGFSTEDCLAWCSREQVLIEQNGAFYREWTISEFGKEGMILWDEYAPDRVDGFVDVTLLPESGKKGCAMHEKLDGLFIRMSGAQRYRR